MTFFHGSTRYSRIEPSRWTPSVSLCSQAFSRPFLHEAHFPQLVYGFTVTTLPLENPSGTPEPVSSMTAPTSCPGITGILTIGFMPL